jgi:hypothetical protein
MRARQPWKSRSSLQAIGGSRGCLYDKHHLAGRASHLLQGSLAACMLSECDVCVSVLSVCGQGDQYGGGHVSSFRACHPGAATTSPLFRWLSTVGASAHLPRALFDYGRYLSFFADIFLGKIIVQLRANTLPSTWLPTWELPRVGDPS